MHQDQSMSRIPWWWSVQHQWRMPGSRRSRLSSKGNSSLQPFGYRGPTEVSELCIILLGMVLLTQRSVFPERLMLDPLGKALPWFVHGPANALEVAIVILFPVENRKYLPSEVRLIIAGSWTLQSPEQAPGVWATTEETSEETLNRAAVKNVVNSIVVVINDQNLL